MDFFSDTGSQTLADNFGGEHPVVARADLPKSRPLHVMILLHSDCGNRTSQRRILQYVHALKRENIHCEVLPFYGPPPRSLKHCAYDGGQTLASSLNKRFHSLRHLRDDIDLVWIEKEALPHMPWLAEKFLLPANIPIITDLGDMDLQLQSQNESSVLRNMFSDKATQMMRNATLVMAGNSHMMERAKQAGATWVEVMPTAITPCTVNPVQRSHADCKLRVGWIGTAPAWTREAEPLFRSLSPIFTQKNAVARVVGARAGRSRCGFLDYHPRTPGAETDQITAMDVALAPLENGPLGEAASGYQIMRYMACGVPVIASPLGAQGEIIEHGVNGFLASNEEEWCSALNALLEDADLRRKIGNAGKAKVEKEFTLPRIVPKIANLLNRAAALKAA
ncbi:glycosyltransferase [Altererythrobacter indicus]|uniref:Glycosyltransferase n=1 Tax=Altericroceibacterium indicum TaxID=374177 RepID=A0A845A5F4_9SPHN|nr:glycosyltransferase family 4 protein [Altericroceibacterium indicum]MXP24954.1 glycosyltransferase [Altericroceibacterium indicum]